MSSSLIDLYVIDTSTNEIIATLDGNNWPDLTNTQGKRLTIAAFPKDDVPLDIVSVRISLNDVSRLDNTSPYSLYPEAKGTFYGNGSFEEQGNVLTVEVFADDFGTGEPLEAFQYSFDIDSGPKVEITKLAGLTFDGPAGQPLPGSTADLADSIIFHFDGNNNDADDIVAIPMAALLTAAAGLEEKMTFFYGNNLTEPNNERRLPALDTSAEFAQSLGIDTYDYQDGVDAATAELVAMLSTGEKILLIEGGPMEATYRALSQVDQSFHSNITLLSHSAWNEKQAVVSLPGVTEARTWVDIANDFPDVTLVDIPDQNGGSGPEGFKSDLWDWMDSAENEIIQQARVAMNQALPYKQNDPSDAGMLYYALTGDISADPLDVKEYLEAAPYFDGTLPENASPQAKEDYFLTDEQSVISGQVLLNDTDPDSDALSVTAVNGSAANVGQVITLSSGASVQLNADGAISYDPNGVFDDLEDEESAQDSVTYKISDGKGGTSSASVTFTVEGISPPPPPSDDEAGLSIELYNADTDELITVLQDGQQIDEALIANVNLTILAVVKDTAPYAEQAESIRLDLNDGAATRTENVAPYALFGDKNGNYFGRSDVLASGENAIIVDVYSGDRLTGDLLDQRTINFTVGESPSNSAPTANAASQSGDENTIIAGTVTAEDIDGDALTYFLDSAPSDGTVILEADGRFSYTPNKDFAGNDSFSFKVTDGNGGSDIETVSITVNEVNEAPVAQTETVSGEENTTISGMLSATDPDGDALNFSLNSAPSNGAAIVNSDGRYTYTPDADFAGEDSFSYRVSDGKGGGTVEAVNITVNAAEEENQPPLARDDFYTTDEANPISGQVLQNDTDSDGDTLTITAVNGSALNVGQVVTLSSGALIQLNANGTFTYTPNGVYDWLSDEQSERDSFNYEVSDGMGGTNTATAVITVEGISPPPPPPTNDESGLRIELFNSDTDELLTVLEDGQIVDQELIKDVKLTVVATVRDDAVYANEAESIRVDLNNGTFARTENVAPYALFGDKQGNYFGRTDILNPGDNSISIDVYSGDRLAGALLEQRILNFTVVEDTETNSAPIAQPASAVTDENSAASGSLNATDRDGDTLSFALESAPANGTSIVNSDGSYTYTPNPDFSGSDSFTYKVSDGNGGVDVQTVSVTVNALNQAPTAQAAAASGDENTVLSGTLIATDPDAGDILTFSVNAAPSNGAAVVNSDGSFTYTPNDDFSGNDSFSFLVTDGNGGSDVETVSVTVKPVQDVNQLPVMGDDYFTISEDELLNGSTLDNDSDPDGDRLVVIQLNASADNVKNEVTLPSGALVLMNRGGTFSYDPNNAFDYLNEGETATDSFTYKVADGNFGKGDAVVTITINGKGDENPDPTNNAPTASDIAGAANENDTVTGDLLATASDPDGDQLFVTEINGSFINYGQPMDLPSGAEITVSEDGSAIYNTNNAFEYLDTGETEAERFTYTISDGNGGSAGATVSLTIFGAYDPDII